MDNTNSNKIKQYWLSYIAMICSVVAIFFSLKRATPFQITNETYIGIIVTLLGLIVAVVVGAQIWNVIELKAQLKDVKRLKDELTATQEAIVRLGSNLLKDICYNQARQKSNDKAYIFAFLGYLETIHHCFRIGDYVVIRTCLSLAKESLQLSIRHPDDDKSSNRIYLALPGISSDILTPKELSRELLDLLLTKCTPKSQFELVKGELLEIKKTFDDNYHKIKGQPREAVIPG